MTSSHRELADLLSRCALGDRSAFERLYRATSAQLYGLVLRIVRNEDLAGEVLQEGYVKIWRHAAQFDPGKATAMTWMGTIIRNQAIDLIRRGASRPRLSDSVEDLHWLADESDDPQEQVDQTRLNSSLHTCLDRLQDDQRKAIILAYFHGLTHEELADYMQKPLGTIKSWLRRGLLRLKKCLDEL